MTPKPFPAFLYPHYPKPGPGLMIQAPLPHCLDTLPILLTVSGQGTARERAVPLAPPEEPANE